MSKEIENRICQFCESEYKLMYDLDDTSGHPKFCCFCGEECYNEEDENESDEN